ncbi:MAG: 5-3 exonuclease [Frankiales bacterium]|nr:5-3 exonuclease [Frankiales bacterium]
MLTSDVVTSDGVTSDVVTGDVVTGDESAATELLLAVDGNSLVHRSFHALAATGMRSPDGAPMWAVRGLLTQLVAAVERIGPTAVVVGFDDPRASLRRDKWPQYKANRVEKLDSLVQQLELAVLVLRELGIQVIVPTGLEADDVLAAAARHASVTAGRTVIMTSDRDSFALIDDHTTVLRIINGGVEASPLLSSARLYTKLGVTPAQYRDFAALRGDPSDNLPGVRGIGPKTAAKLLSALGSARAAFDDIDCGGEHVLRAVGAGALARLREPTARESWSLNCQVMALHDTVDLALTRAGGPGRLPLDSAVVRAVFTDHQLPASTPTALRALCHEQSDGPAVRYAVSGGRGQHQDQDGGAFGGQSGRSGGWRGARHGRMANRAKQASAPQAEQLSLFG